MCEYCSINHRVRWKGKQLFDDEQCSYGINLPDAFGNSAYMNATGIHEVLVDDGDMWKETCVINIPIKHCPNCGCKL